MFEYIKRLQTKSLEERKKAALVISGVITSIIILIWLSTFGLKDSESQVGKQVVDLTPVQSIKGAVLDIYTTFKNLGENIKNVNYSINELRTATTSISATSTNELGTSTTSISATSTP